MPALLQSDHLPPDHIRVADYMAELTAFINRADKPKYDLDEDCAVHHRFGWIHPAWQQCGRTVRLLTYRCLSEVWF